MLPGYLTKVFLDYGIQWEEDWNNHVTSWEAPSDDYVSIKEMTDAGVFRTVKELEDDPYPSNVKTACLYDDGYDDESYNDIDNDDADDDDEYDTVAEDWITNGGNLAAAARSVDETDEFDVWPCDVLSKEKDENGSDIYEVEIFQKSNEEETVWYMNDYRRILTNVTKDILLFRPAQYTSDQHLSGVFRSHLRIPDEMFPEQWKNIAHKSFH